MLGAQGSSNVLVDEGQDSTFGGVAFTSVAEVENHMRQVSLAKKLASTPTKSWAGKGTGQQAPESRPPCPQDQRPSWRIEGIQGY